MPQKTVTETKRTYAPFKKVMIQKEEVCVEKAIVEQKSNEVNRPVARTGAEEKRKNEENAPEESKERRIPIIVTEMNTAEVVRGLRKKNIEPDMRRNGKVVGPQC